MDEQPESIPAHEDAPAVRGRPFPPGHSGNRNGRPKGARNKNTVRLEELLAEHGEAILLKFVEQALDGDRGALRQAIGKLIPQLRSRPIEFELPLIENRQDAASAVSLVLQQCTTGVLTLDDASKLLSIVK
jgi:hypothetical protein